MQKVQQAAQILHLIKGQAGSIKMPEMNMLIS
jgi:hypothetical protein